MRKFEKVKPICFYLPQFHRVPENDQWWGEGFTEWTLLHNAKSLFPGHQQPEMPDETLGYYDASERGTRRRQAELARESGIYGFCYYHYWFAGKRLLEKPLENMLEDGEPDLPFCLCWANESWSRRWSGEEQQVLQAQVYGGRADWEKHFEELSQFFGHKNYICVEGQPVFLIYRVGHIPDARSMIACWRELALERGFPGLHIVAVQGGFEDSKISPDFVDAMADHQPSSVLDRCQPLVINGLRVYSVEQVWQHSLQNTTSVQAHYPGVCHAWDNSPRRGRDGSVVLASRPQRFHRHLQQLFEQVEDQKPAQFVFVNAWNEWSEGAHLEPEVSKGRQWLDCFRDVLKGVEAVPLEAMLLSKELYTGLCPDRLIERQKIDPDPDLINIVIQHQVKASRVLEFGCAKGLSSEHLKNYTGADRYIGLEPDPAWLKQSKQRLNEALLVNADSPGLSRLDGFQADFIICSELLGRVVDPVLVLSQFRDLVHPEGLLCLGFEHQGELADAGLMRNRHRDGMRYFSGLDIRSMLRETGFRIDKVYRVYSPQLSRVETALAQGKPVRSAKLDLQSLNRAELEDMFCLRSFVFVRPDFTAISTGSAVDACAGQRQQPGLEPDDVSLDYSLLASRLSWVISPMDNLYSVYKQNGAEEEYFRSAYRQLNELDGLLRQHSEHRLLTLSSIADYACHYGRLLRMFRAALPETELLAYDVDPQAVEFCERHFSSLPGVVGWKDDAAQLMPRHQLLTCASLLTHTGIDFYRQVLSVWERLVQPGGLICFTYLGDRYISKWLNGELDHYGPVSAQLRVDKAKAYQQRGHALAGFDTPYSKAQDYGVGFMSESTVVAELAHHPQLEYLGTIPGDHSEFNQDLAVVRKRER